MPPVSSVVKKHRLTQIHAEKLICDNLCFIISFYSVQLRVLCGEKHRLTQIYAKELICDESRRNSPKDNSPNHRTYRRGHRNIIVFILPQIPHFRKFKLQLTSRDAKFCVSTLHSRCTYTGRLRNGRRRKILRLYNVNGHNTGILVQHSPFGICMYNIATDSTD